MPAIDVEFDVSEVLRAIDRLGQRNKNLPMDLIGQMLVSEVDDVFQSQGSAGSAGPWQPMSPNTVARHPRRAGGMLLQDSGRTANIQVGSFDEHSVTVFSPTSQAKFHLSGTEFMPQRDFFALRFNDVLDALGDVVLQEFQR